MKKKIILTALISIVLAGTLVFIGCFDMFGCENDNECHYENQYLGSHCPQDTCDVKQAFDEKKSGTYTCDCMKLF